MAIVSIYTEAGHETSELGAFFTANADGFMSEDLQYIFAQFAEGKPVVLGGGAAELFVVKLYEPGDEDLDLWHGAGV